MIDTSKVLIYNNEFGTVTVVHPAPKYEGTIEDIKAGIGTDRAIDGVIHIVDRSDVPTDRSFRGAWTYTPLVINMGFGIDMSKAKDIHRNNIRSSRKDKLAELDIEFQKAQETSSDTSAIVAKKQVLRDYPARAGIATAANTTELKADWDTTILGDKPKGY